MNENEIIEKIQSIICNILNEDIAIDESVVLREIEEDRVSLGLSSLDMMDLIIQIEMEFGIEIEPESYPSLYDIGNLVQKIIDLMNSDEKTEIKEIEDDLFN
jgi:acyl carrier protein